MKIRILVIMTLLFISCKKDEKQEVNNVTAEKKSETQNTENAVNKTNADTIVLSTKHKTNKILCDLDGDGLSETVEIVRSTKNKKSGLRITFGNGNKTVFFGMGNDILDQGFDEIDWAGIFEKAPKNELYWDNVGENGDILADEEIKETDKIKLLNDGIFIHAEESCGGGIIYLEGGKYKWIQQE